MKSALLPGKERDSEVDVDGDGDDLRINERNADFVVDFQAKKSFSKSVHFVQKNLGGIIALRGENISMRRRRTGIYCTNKRTIWTAKTIPTPYIHTIYNRSK